jgi:hypothetical protein
MAIIEETLWRYNVDGLELDWSRSGWAFKPGQELQNVELMNEFTRGIHRLMVEIGTQRDRTFVLAVSVPSSFRECLEIGLDVATWLREGLVDVLIAGGPPFSPDLQEVRKATREANCRLYSRLIWNRNIFVSPEVVRAAALLHWRQGVDGLYVFNFNHHAEGLGAIREIGEPDQLKHVNKCYVLDKNPNLQAQQLHHTVRPAAPRAYLPVVLELDSAGPGQTIRFELGDDIEADQKEGILCSARIRLKLDNFSPELDELVFNLNGTPLSWDLLNLTREDGINWLEFSLDGGPLQRGDNTLQVGLRSKLPNIRSPLVLSHVEVCINYQ